MSGKTSICMTCCLLIWSETRNGLSPLLFNFALQYALRRLQVNLGGLKLNGTHQLMVYVDVNILGGRVHTVKKNRNTLVVASKEIGLEVNAYTIKYMVVSRSQNVG